MAHISISYQCMLDGPLGGEVPWFTYVEPISIQFNSMLFASISYTYKWIFPPPPPKKKERKKKRKERKKKRNVVEKHKQFEYHCKLW